MANQLANLRAATRYQIEQEVVALNDQLATLTSIDVEISHLRTTTDANRELDERDQLINLIAEVVDVTRHERVPNSTGVSFGGTSIQQGVTTLAFDTFTNSDGTVDIVVESTETPSEFNGGRLPALLELHNETIPEFEARLEEAAIELMRSFDQLHAVGIGPAGSFSVLNANRSVRDTTVPLNEAGTAFPIEQGELFFSVIDANGDRTTESIDIDPSVDSLADVATKISALPNLSANIDPQTNQLQIVAPPGFEFDFTGNIQTHPDLGLYTGSAVPTFSGSYEGATNRTLSFVMEGTGTVGVSDDLYVNVFAEDGTQLGKLPIGNGYEAGSEIEVMDGIKISFPAGDVADGDSFDAQLISNPDSTGTLSALGLNSFFKGFDAASIEVADEIRADHNRFASGKTDEYADTNNLFVMIELQFEQIVDNDRLTLGDALNEMTTDIGSRVRNNTQLSFSFNLLKESYEQERDSVSGVDLNEEMIHLQQFQKSYEAAVRVIQAAESMFDELFNALR